MNGQRAIPLFVLASLALHGAGFYGWDPGASSGREPAKPEEKVIELVPFKPPEEPFPVHGQVVETPDLPAADQAPENARFLAERNLRVDRETLGRVADRVGRQSGAMTSPLAQPPAPSQAEAGESGGKLAAKELYPSFRDLWQMVPESGGRIDHIEGVAEGEVTALNTREFRYAAFYNRVKQAVRAYWDPQPAVLRSGMPRHNLDTYLRFVTDADGKLLLVEVIHSCGYPAVDQAAVRAMEQATPFYGVPKGLLNEKGELDEVFGFHVILE
jgi:TonB family protein